MSLVKQWRAAETGEAKKEPQKQRTPLSFLDTRLLKQVYKSSLRQGQITYK
jgi:hypothetical protein